MAEASEHLENLRRGIEKVADFTAGVSFLRKRDRGEAYEAASHMLGTPAENVIAEVAIDILTELRELNANLSAIRVAMVRER